MRSDTTLAHRHGILQIIFAWRERKWVEAMMARLFWGYVDWAIEGLEALQPRGTQAAEAIRKLIGFLRSNGRRLHYRTARKGGYPIESGGIEADPKEPRRGEGESSRTVISSEG